MRSAIIILLSILIAFSTRAQNDQDAFVEGMVILKVKAAYRPFTADSEIDINRLKPVLERLKVTSIRKLFPNAAPLQSDRSPQNPGADKRVDISLIYEVTYARKIDPRKAAVMIRNTETVEYAEPRFIAQALIKPNDILIDSQYHLPLIRAFEAWDIEKGSEDITIAIVDTGVDWDHPDLADALLKNEDEIPNNGVDDDQNGFIDDYIGWNFYDNNNDPMEVGFSHGTHVAGLAGAITNNSLGVAGISWSCKIMAIKSGDKLVLPNGYEGIVYAADNGADIINCSWGGFNRSDYAHDIVSYATYNAQALVVAGAGNDNRENLFYPASYREVVSVASTNAANLKADFSNYNYKIDIVAPGKQVFSLKNDTYGKDSGTSMSSPIVAGAAALVLSHYPQLSPLQIMEQLRVSANADSIYQKVGNEAYIGKLGTGLLDMYESLFTISSPGLRIDYSEVSDNDDGIYTLNEEIYIGLEVANYLQEMNDVTITIEALDENISVIEGVWQVPSLPQNGRANNLNAPFSVKLDSLGERNQLATMKVTASSPHTNYTMVEYLTFNVFQDYVNVNVNNVATTVSKNGLFGYTDFLQTNGLGFQLEAHGNLLYEGGLMIGYNDNGIKKVADRLRNGDFGDQDFWEESIIERMVPSGEEAYLATGSFTDSNARLDKIGLLIEQKVVAYDDSGHRNYVLLDYTLHNTSDEDLQGVSVGMLADWDIINADINLGKTISGKRLGYVYHSGEEQLTAGVQALGYYPFRSYMIDNVSGGNGGVDMYDEEGFTSEEKYTIMHSDRLENGSTDSTDGLDVLQSASMYSIDIPMGGSANVVFAIHAGVNNEVVFESADNAYQRFYGYLPGENIVLPFEVRNVWPVPTTTDLNVSFDLKEEGVLSIEVYNVQGRMVKKSETNNLFPGFNQIRIKLPELRTGVYFVKLFNDQLSKTIPFHYLTR